MQVIDIPEKVLSNARYRDSRTLIKLIKTAYEESENQAITANVNPYITNWFVMLPSRFTNGGIKAPKNNNVFGFDHISKNPWVK